MTYYYKCVEYTLNGEMDSSESSVIAQRMLLMIMYLKVQKRCSCFEYNMKLRLL